MSQYKITKSLQLIRDGELGVRGENSGCDRGYSISFRVDENALKLTVMMV